jgi:hypothetical protein
MKHLTHVGPNAGKTLCGTNKQTAIDEGCTFLHFPYYDANKPYCADVCEKCKAIIVDIDEAP